MKPLIVIALGGNAIKQAQEKGTNEEQCRNVRQTTGYLAKLAKEGYGIVITHGNGPQIGNILIQHETARHLVPVLPMDVCGAESQGQIGYMIQQALINHFSRSLRMETPKMVVSVVTQVEVDPSDRAFQNPTKPVGPFYDKKSAEELKQKGYTVIEDSGRGYRRAVPSPKPVSVVEIGAIKKLVDNNVVVICAGGGGIPVIKKNNEYAGVEAVVDKDWAAALIAKELKADVLLLLTDVEKAALNYRKPNEVFLDFLTIGEAEKYLGEGHFAEGSMGPKVEAAVEFVKHGGKKAVITHLFKVLEALEGKTGTHISSNK